jgi:hypothetical protein
MSESIHQKLPYKSEDRTYAPLKRERDTLSAQPAPGAYDGKALYDSKKPVPANVMTKHDGATPPIALEPLNDGERALDVSVGRKSFERDEEAGNIFNDK